MSRKVDKAILKFQLIEPGDKILLAVSGGKDSLAMAWFLGHKQKGFPIPFELGAIHIEGDFPGCGNSPVIGRSDGRVGRALRGGEGAHHGTTETRKEDELLLVLHTAPGWS